MNLSRRFLSFVAVFSLLGLCAGAPRKVWKEEIRSAFLTRVIDGDTFECQVELRPGLMERRIVRLDCFNAPEKREPGGDQATARLQTWFQMKGTAGVFQLRTSWKLDKYGRLLGEPRGLNGEGFCREAETSSLPSFDASNLDNKTSLVWERLGDGGTGLHLHETLSGDLVCGWENLEDGGVRWMYPTANGRGCR